MKSIAPNPIGLCNGRKERKRPISSFGVHQSSTEEEDPAMSIANQEEERVVGTKDGLGGRLGHRDERHGRAGCRSGLGAFFGYVDEGFMHYVGERQVAAAIDSGKIRGSAERVGHAHERE